MDEHDGPQRPELPARSEASRGETRFARDVEPLQPNHSLTAVPPKSWREKAGAPDANPAPAKPGFLARQAEQDDPAAAPAPLSAPTHEVPVSDEQRALEHALRGGRDEEASESPVAPHDHDDTTAAEDHAPRWGQDEQARAERERAFDFGGSHAVTHDHVVSPSEGRTEAQSGAALVDDAEAATEVQAGDLGGPGDVLDVRVQEQADTATLGAAGSMTGQTLSLAGVEEQRRAPGARGYHGGDGLFGDRRAEALPTDARSRLARAAWWVKERPDSFDARGLAVGGVPRYALATHVDEQGQERVYVHTNIGPGMISKPLPSGARVAWDHAAGGSDRGVLARMLGHPDPVHGLVAHYRWTRDGAAARGARYWLAGIATAYAPEEPEGLRRLVQPLNDHLPDQDAPFLVEAHGPLAEPEEGSAHPLQRLAPELHARLAAVLASPWAGEARAHAAGWVASILDGSTARDRPAFANVVAAIRERPPVLPELFDAVWADGAHVHAQTAHNLQRAMSTPEAQRGQADFLGYLLYHRALVGLVALNHWRGAAHGHDHAFLVDLAYLVAKANQDDPAFPARIAAQLPDPTVSYWKPR